MLSWTARKEQMPNVAVGHGAVAILKWLGERLETKFDNHFSKFVLQQWRHPEQDYHCIHLRLEWRQDMPRVLVE